MTNLLTRRVNLLTRRVTCLKLSEEILLQLFNDSSKSEVVTSIKFELRSRQLSNFCQTLLLFHHSLSHCIILRGQENMFESFDWFDSKYLAIQVEKNCFKSVSLVYTEKYSHLRDMHLCLLGWENVHRHNTKMNGIKKHWKNRGTILEFCNRKLMPKTC